MYTLVTKDCPSGYAYVQDYQGNKIYFGPVEACKKCISHLTSRKKGGKKNVFTRSQRH